MNLARARPAPLARTGAQFISGRRRRPIPSMGAEREPPSQLVAVSRAGWRAALANGRHHFSDLSSCVCARQRQRHQSLIGPPPAQCARAPAATPPRAGAT